MTLSTLARVCAAAMGMGGAVGSAIAQPCPRWVPLGSGPGVNGSVGSILRLSDGDLIVGGLFSAAGNVPAMNIARYHPATDTWSAMGAGVPLAATAIVEMPDGSIVAGTTKNFSTDQTVWKWDGTQWTWMGMYGDVYSMKIAPNGHLMVDGQWMRVGGSNASIVEWDGSNWSIFWAGAPWGTTHELLYLPSGELIAAGDAFPVSSLTTFGLARWTGSAWSEIGGGNSGWIFAMAATGGDTFVAGGLLHAVASNQPASNILQWNGSAWTQLGGGVLDVGPRSIVRTPDGGLLVAVPYKRGSYNTADQIRRWNGVSWSALTPDVNAGVYSLVVLPNGDVLAGGNFTTGGGVLLNHIARWTTRPVCAGDHNCSGGLSTQDIFDFLNDWLAHDLRADFNASGALDGLDIFDFVNSWFAGC